MHNQHRSVVDLTLHVKSAAWAVAHHLADTTCGDVGAPDVRTAAWYNGRERGLVFTFGNLVEWRDALHVAVFEHRNSDAICALRWVGEYGNNPPTWQTPGAYPTDDKWADLAHTVGPDEARRMALWVENEARAWAAGPHARYDAPAA